MASRKWEVVSVNVKWEVGGTARGRCSVFLSNPFFRSVPLRLCLPRYERTGTCTGGTGDNALGPSATKARGQNTEHDRVARRRCYLDDRVHGEQRQRCHRHRCHCHDIPGIWRFGRERLLCARTTRTQTHEKKDWTATNCRCRSGARSSNRLLSSVAIAVAARYSHSLYCATIIEAGIANNARSRAP